MASFGELAGTFRSSARTPSHSLIVGLLGAALGIPRDDSQLVDLSNEIAIAVRIDRDGGAVVDYHTVETPHGKFKQRPRTRWEELSTASKTEAVITRREYRQDVSYTVVTYQLTDSPSVSLDQIRKALEKPRFPLYLGRRSCPLAEPPNPEFVQNAPVSELLGSERLAFDGRLDPGDCQPHHAIDRNDLLVGKRQFASRRELLT